MPKLIDLTLTLGGPGITPVPGLPSVTFEPVHTHERNYRSNTKVVLATHIGTHVDAPYHFVPGGTTIDEMPLETFVAPGVLLDLRDVTRPRSPFTLDQVRRLGIRGRQLKGRIAILFSGWVAQQSGKPNLYTDNPYMHPEVAEYLVKAGVKAIGVDFAVDPGVLTPDPSAYPVHRIALGRGVPLIENLINLDRLVGRRFEVWALPVKFYRGDGGACRAVARVIR
ncbi:MAG: cyclase family protein [Chloroflexi bacterium]|nr:cyclase family protein [Chloroflexota bacterium]